jgi:hypothetical protein
LKFRPPLKITGRTSSVTNSFVQAIIPNVKPTEAELEEALNVLGMSLQNRRCVYCGVSATDWDHLRPLVKHKRPTGFLNEAQNLVPSCAPCNQSKSGANWKEWMEGLAPGAPRSKGVQDIAERIAVLEKFEQWGNLTSFPIEEVIGAEKWKEYWGALQEIHDKMQAAQIIAEQIQKFVQQRYAEVRAAR